MSRRPNRNLTAVYAPPGRARARFGETVPIIGEIAHLRPGRTPRSDGDPRQEGGDGSESPGNTVLVTGGTSGIGLANAQAFSDLGNRIRICGRSPEKLDAAKRAHPSFDVFPCDITRPDQVQTMFEGIAERHPDLNVLFNNAGSLNPSDFLSNDGALPKAQQETETNLLGSLSVTKSAFPS